MKTFGILSDNGDYLYLFDSLGSLIEGTLGERDIDEDEELVRIDSYTIMAVGPSHSHPPKK